MDEVRSEDKSLLSDSELAARINGGDYALYSVLIDRLMPHIVSVAAAQKGVIPDTDDLVGEGIMAVFSAVRSFTPDKSSFKTFANLCIDRAIGARVKSALAAKRIPNMLVTSLDDVEITDGNSPESIVIKREAADDFSAAIKNNLSIRERNVLLRFLSGESYADIAKNLDITVKSVDSAMQRVRQKLKK